LIRRPAACNVTRKMPSKREALALLARDELPGVVDECELEVPKTSSGLDTINSIVASDMLGPLPFQPEQSRIAAFFGELDARIASEHVVRQASIVLKATFVSVLLAGEVRVQPDKAAV